MEKTTKVELRELANSVTASVDVEIRRTAPIEELLKESEQEALNQAISLFDKAQKHATLKTMEKNRR